MDGMNGIALRFILGSMVVGSACGFIYYASWHHEHLDYPRCMALAKDTARDVKEYKDMTAECHRMWID